MNRSISRAGAAFGAALLVIAASAAPALACGGLIGPNGAVNLLRTTTLAAYHDGQEHYVTAFQFAGGGGAFGSLTPLPGIPSSVEKGGDWTLQRLVRETDPVPEALFAAGAAPRGRLRRGAHEGPHRCPRHHRPARRRGGGRYLGHGPRLPPPARRPRGPRLLREPLADLPGGRVRCRRRAARGQSVGDGTPVHVTIPTDNPWVPLRILALGKTAAERVDASVYLLTDQRPALLPAPTGDNGLGLAHSAPATVSLLDDLRSDRGMGWVPIVRLADQGHHRRRGARPHLRPRDRRLGRRRAIAAHGRARPAGHPGRPAARPAMPAHSWSASGCSSSGVGGIVVLLVGRRRAPLSAA